MFKKRIDAKFNSNYIIMEDDKNNEKMVALKKSKTQNCAFEKRDPKVRSIFL
jgi:hypothetical protein